MSPAAGAPGMSVAELEHGPAAMQPVDSPVSVALPGLPRAYTRQALMTLAFLMSAVCVGLALLGSAAQASSMQRPAGGLSSAEGAGAGLLLLPGAASNDPGQQAGGVSDPTGVAWAAISAIRTARLQLLQQGWCAYGTLPGIWVSRDAPSSASADAGATAVGGAAPVAANSTEGTPTPPGARWRLFNPQCKLRNRLLPIAAPSTELARAAAAAASAASSQGGSAAGGEGPAPNADSVTILDAPAPEAGPAAAGGASSAAAADPGPPRAAGGSRGSSTGAGGILFVSDSVDRHILTYLCEHAGGKVKAVALRSALRDAMGVSEASLTALLAGSGGAGGSAAAPAEAGAGAAGGASASLAALGLSASPANMSAYIVNTCGGAMGGLRLAATYFPGVHPTGPYHKQRRLSFRQRVDHAAAVWRAYSDEPPDIVVVSSLLWDLARLSSFEPWAMQGPELPKAVLRTWVSNYTEVVKYTKAAFPRAQMYVYHTNMVPQYDPATGVLQRSYLGRRTHVQQLNAAGRHVAAQLGMEVLDYAAVADRFLDGQTYLTDAIHPNREVGLEVANLYLNYIEQLRAGVPSAPAPQQQGGAQGADRPWRHPSAWGGASSRQQQLAMLAALNQERLNKQRQQQHLQRQQRALRGHGGSSVLQQQGSDGPAAAGSGDHELGGVGRHLQ